MWLFFWLYNPKPKASRSFDNRILHAPRCSSSFLTNPTTHTSDPVSPSQWTGTSTLDRTRLRPPSQVFAERGYPSVHRWPASEVGRIWHTAGRARGDVGSTGRCGASLGRFEHDRELELGRSVRWILSVRCRETWEATPGQSCKRQHPEKWESWDLHTFFAGEGVLQLRHGTSHLIELGRSTEPHKAPPRWRSAQAQRGTRLKPLLIWKEEGTQAL